MPLNWTTTDLSSAAQGVKLLVYSGSGIGKTRLCSTAPYPVILSAESGLLSLRKFKIPVIQIVTLADLMDAYSWLANSKEANQFQTACIDSITEIAEVVLANLIKTVGKNDPRKAFGELIPQMAQTIRAFRDLPNKHVYMAAKMDSVKDDIGITKYGPAMPGQKLGPQLPYFFDEVFRLGVGKFTDAKGTVENYRFLQTQPDPQYDAKDRSGSLEPMEPPDLSVVFKKILAV